MKTLEIGMVGLDTSHVSAFARLLHDTSQEDHVPGARIMAAYPGGSSDFSISINRLEEYTEELRSVYNVEIVDSLSALRGKCDAVMIESVDGRVHLEQFREMADWKVPVFIDKPLAVSSKQAREIKSIAEDKKMRVASASALRFADAFQQALKTGHGTPVIGADFYGPMPLEEKCPGYFWYGIHSAEMLYETMGAGCREVLATREGLYDVVVGRWADGRMGVLRGSRAGNNSFGGVIHRKTGSVAFDVSSGKRHFYASLLENVLSFFRGEGEVVAIDEMVEVICFLEAANRSLITGQWTAL